MINSILTRELGLTYPIFQGGMAWVSDAQLAAAVSNAGGLGIISAMNLNADYLREQIRKCRTLTDKPFGVNVMLMSPFVKDVAQVCAEEKPAVVTTGAGLPNLYMKDWLAAGIRVIPVVPSTAMARLVERAGAFAVIAEGGESGGHIGDLSTITLVPQVKDAVSIPVIAAGGIGDGRGVAAALMLGAEGVQCGTVFLCSTECTIHDNYKQKVLSAKDIDTIVTGKRLGHAVRSIRSPFTRKYAKLEYEIQTTGEELEQMGVGALRKAALDGDIENGCFIAGQCSAMVNEIRPAREIIETMFAQAETLLKGAPVWVK
ncbi:MAG TPA: nitronate monooxygenase [Candidatus Limiplasma sp.]|nr:nitronate monooxygenase [Candidatus Limiplasma sp.]HRX08075.1 nitronate monooxygenase [Candidatus Limiplasma sp.]